MGIKMSTIHPDRELRDFLTGKIVVGKSRGGTAPVTVYSDWERPTNGLPADFLVIYMNGNVEGLGTNTNYASGYISVSLYCKMNSDGSVKANRIDKILEQFEKLVDKKKTKNFFFAYDTERYITPTAPNQSSGYSTTTLNLMWHTTQNFNAEQESSGSGSGSEQGA